MRKKKIWGVALSLLFLFIILSYPKSCSKKNPPPLISKLKTFAIPCRDLQVGRKFYEKNFSFKFKKKYALQMTHDKKASAISMTLKDEELILYQSFAQPKNHQLNFHIPDLSIHAEPIQHFEWKGKTIKSIFIQDPSGNAIQCVENRSSKPGWEGVSILVTNLEEVEEFYRDILGFHEFYTSSCEGCFANQHKTYSTLVLQENHSLQVSFLKSSEKIPNQLCFFQSTSKRFHTLKGLLHLEGFDPSNIFTTDKIPFFWVKDPNQIPLLILKE